MRDAIHGINIGHPISYDADNWWHSLIFKKSSMIISIIMILSVLISLIPFASAQGDSLSGQFEVKDSISDIGNVDLALIKDPIFNQNGVAIWEIMPDSNYPYVDQLKFYAKIDTSNNQLSLLLAGNDQSKSLRGMIPSLYKLQGEDATLSTRPDLIHYCYPYDSSKTLIYSLLKDSFNEIKSNSVIGPNAQLDGNPKYKSSFTNEVSIFGYYITSTAFNNDNFCYHNWPWGTGTDECQYGRGSYICDYSTGTVQATFDFNLVDPTNYYIFGFINNDNGEETKYLYNNDLWLHQVDYGPGSTAGEKFGDNDFPSQIALYGRKTWSANRLMTWMAVNADSVSATGHITGDGPTHVDRNEDPDVLQSISLEKGLIEWPITDPNIIFEDDFSTDKGWISNPPNEIFRDANQENVDFYTNRGNVQSMYHSIDPLQDDFELSVDVNLEDTNANGFIYIGLTDDINNVDWYWKGLGIVIGRYAGFYFAEVAAKYSDGSMYVSMSDNPSEDKHINILTNKWYTYKLTKDGQNWKLDAYDENKNLAGSISGEFTGDFSVPFNYVLFGNGDASQWETADGKIDNFRLSSIETSALSSIGDWVWEDTDGNGIQNEGESGIEGVTVNLYKFGEANVLMSTETDSSGLYLFDELEPGEYQVEFALPDGYAISPKDQGGDDTKDSDVDPNSERIDLIQGLGGINYTLDAGMYQQKTPEYIYPIYDYVDINIPQSASTNNMKTNLESSNRPTSNIEFKDISIYVGKGINTIHINELGKDFPVDEHGNITLKMFDIYEILANGTKKITINYKNRNNLPLSGSLSDNKVIELVFSFEKLENPDLIDQFLEFHKDIVGVMDSPWNGQVTFKRFFTHGNCDFTIKWDTENKDIKLFYTKMDEYLRMLQFNYFLLDPEVRSYIKKEIELEKERGTLDDNSGIYRQIKNIMQTMDVPMSCTIEIPDIKLSEEVSLEGHNLEPISLNTNTLGYNDEIRLWYTVGRSHNPSDPGGVIFHIQTNAFHLDNASGIVKMAIQSANTGLIQIPCFTLGLAAFMGGDLGFSSEILDVFRYFGDLGTLLGNTEVSMFSLFIDYKVDIAIPVLQEKTPDIIRDADKLSDIADACFNDVNHVYFPLISDENYINFMKVAINLFKDAMGMTPVTQPIHRNLEFVQSSLINDLNSYSISLHFDSAVNPLVYNEVLENIYQNVNSNINFNYNFKYNILGFDGAFNAVLSKSFIHKIYYPNAIFFKVEGLELSDLLRRIYGMGEILYDYYIDIYSTTCGFIVGEAVVIPVVSDAADYIAENICNQIIHGYGSLVIDYVNSQIKSALTEPIYNLIINLITTHPITTDFYIYQKSSDDMTPSILPIPANVFHINLNNAPISMDQTVNLPIGYFKLSGSFSCSLSAEEKGDQDDRNLLQIFAERYLKYKMAPSFDVIIKCPIDVELIDPDGIRFNKNSGFLPGFAYIEKDIDSDGENEKIMNVTSCKQGIYKILVIPQADAKPNETYSLSVYSNNTIITLAENTLVSDIPNMPYVIEVTGRKILKPITVEKIANHEFASFGSTMNYLINITNTGNSIINSLRATDRLPSGMDYISDNKGGTISGKDITWNNLGNFNPGESVIIQLVARIDRDATGDLTNLIEVSGTKSTEEQEEVSDSACATVKVLKPGIKVEKALGIPEPVQYSQFCENQKISGKGKIDVSTSVVDKKLALNYQNNMAGEGDVELDSESAVSEKSSKLMRNIGNNSTPVNLYENTKMTYSGDTPLTGQKRLQSDTFYGGIGAEVQEAFSVNEMEKSQQAFFSSTDPASGASDQNETDQLRNASATHLVGMNSDNSFNGTWGTDSLLHKAFYQDIRDLQSFTGNFEVQKLIKFHENPEPEKKNAGCEGLDC